MTMYLLLETIDRVISNPTFFATEDEALSEMVRRVSEATEIPVPTLMIKLIEGCEDEIGVSSSSAWCDAHGSKYDWKVVPIVTP